MSVRVTKRKRAKTSVSSSESADSSAKTRVTIREYNTYRRQSIRIIALHVTPPLNMQCTSLGADV